MVLSTSSVTGSSPGPAPSAKARCRSSRLTRSSWRAWPKVKLPQERPQGGRSPELVSEHRLGPPGPQGVAIVDGVASGQQGANDGHGLVPDVGPSGSSAQIHVGVEQLLQPEVL